MLEPTTEKSGRSDPWDDDGIEAKNRLHQPLTRDEAQAVVAANPSLSPWRVIAAQAALGLVLALLALLVTRQVEMFWSALYGAGVVVVPGALMARGMTSRLTRLSPAISVAGVLVWEAVKVAAAVLMLVSAPKLVQPLSWPALLATMAACMTVYWFALVWRGAKKN